MSTPIMTDRLNEVDPQVWLADLFAHIAAALSYRMGNLIERMFGGPGTFGGSLHVMTGSPKTLCRDPAG